MTCIDKPWGWNLGLWFDIIYVYRPAFKTSHDPETLYVAKNKTWCGKWTVWKGTISLCLLVISACMHFFSAGVFALALLPCCMQPIDKKRFQILTRSFWGHFVYFLYNFRLKSSLCVISQQDSAGFIKLWEIKSPLMILFTRQRLPRQLMQQQAAWWILSCSLEK